MTRNTIALVALVVLAMVAGTLTPAAEAQSSWTEGSDYKYFYFEYEAAGNSHRVRNDWNIYGGATDIPYYIHNDVINAGYEDAVRNAFSSMENEPSSNISFIYMGSTSTLSEIRTRANGTCCPLPDDGTNVVSFGALPNGFIGRGGYQGTFNIDATGAPDGTGSAELDITLSDTTSLAVGAVPGAIDVESLVLHELGHALGLDHPTTNRDTVMWDTIDTGKTKRVLHPADRFALANMYPVAPMPPASAEFIAVTPCAVFDSRSGAQVTGGEKVTAQISGPVPTSQIVEGCANAGAIPANATGAMINVVAIAASNPGNLKISASGAFANGGIVNFARGETNSNAVPVELSANGAVDVVLNGPGGQPGAHVRLVVLGYYVAPNASSLAFTPVTPCAVFDTRSGDGQIVGGATVTAQISGAVSTDQIEEDCANLGVVPPSATGVMVNVVAVGATQRGNLKISAAGSIADGGIVNFSAGQTNSNAVPVELSTNGAVDVAVNGPAGVATTHIRLGILGYYT